MKPIAVAFSRISSDRGRYSFKLHVQKGGVYVVSYGNVNYFHEGEGKFSRGRGKKLVM